MTSPTARFSRPGIAARRLRLPILTAWLLLFPLAALADPASSPRTLRCGWYTWDPYQFIDPEAEIPVLTGLDIKLTREIFRDAGYAVDYNEVSWEQHQVDIREGTRDIASGAYMTQARTAYAWFSEPYRTETDVLYVPTGVAARIPARNLAELLRRLSAERFRLGIVEGYHYGDEVMAWVKAPANAGLAFPAGTDYDNMVRLIEGRIDGFLADRLSGATMAWRRELQGRIEEHPIPVFTGELRVMFSKRTMTRTDVAAFNRSLARLRASGFYDKVVREYLFPVLLAITIHRPWFFLMGIIGTFAFAISGVLLARKERYDLFGAFVMAFLPSVGGGVIRDLITDRNPLDAMRSPVYILIVLGVVLAGTAFYRTWDLVQAHRRKSGGDRWTGPRSPFSPNFARNLFLTCDALGLAAFTTVGVVVAVEMRCDPLWLWGPILATLTGAGGGILRDIVRADSQNPYLKGALYPEISLVWGLAFSIFLIWETSRLQLSEVLLGVILTLAGVLLTRWLAVRYDVQSLFLYDHKRHAPAVILAEVDTLQMIWLGSLPALLDGFRESADPAAGMDPEAAVNRCLAQEHAIQTRLTELSPMQLPDKDVKSKVLLEQRQWRLSALQADLREFTINLAGAPGEDPAAVLRANLVESLDALLHLTVDAFRDRPGAEAGFLLQVTGQQEEALARIREQYRATLQSTESASLRAVLNWIGLFERCVSHLRALGQSLAG